VINSWYEITVRWVIGREGKRRMEHKKKEGNATNTNRGRGNKKRRKEK